MHSRRLATFVALMGAAAAFGTASIVTDAIGADWIEVGADPQARYYIDVDSIKVDGENVSVIKRGIYTQVLTDTLGDKPATFKETVGTVEIDCVRRINRITRIDMVGENGDVVWSSGPMKQRQWEDVRPNTHAEATVGEVCRRLQK